MSSSTCGWFWVTPGDFGSSLVAQQVNHCLQCKRPRLNPWVGKIPWRREWLPTPVYRPGEFHGLSMGSQRVGHVWATCTSLLVVIPALKVTVLVIQSINAFYLFWTFYKWNIFLTFFLQQYLCEIHLYCCVLVDGSVLLYHIPLCKLTQSIYSFCFWWAFDHFQFGLL